MERLLRQMKSRIEMDQEVIEKFREKLGNDPTYAFEWGDEAMKAAARLRVFRHYVGSIEGAADTIATNPISTSSYSTTSLAVPVTVRLAARGHPIQWPTIRWKPTPNCWI